MMTSQDRFKVVGLIALIVTVAIGLAFVVRMNSLQRMPTKPIVIAPLTSSVVSSTIPDNTILSSTSVQDVLQP